ncbi:leucine-rich repeat-containing protein 56-like [Salvelinus alpinus]
MFCCDNSTLASGSWLCRDLGTTLSHLQVLWISHCSLVDLDALPSSSLKELYVVYNRVSNLSQVSMLENLQLLDLEGNDVDDLVQVQYLDLRSQLCTLTLEGNPVCMHPHPNATEERAASVSAYSRPSSGQRLANSLSSSRPSSRPVSARPLSAVDSRPLSGS